MFSHFVKFLPDLLFAVGIGSLAAPLMVARSLCSRLYVSDTGSPSYQCNFPFVPLQESPIMDDSPHRSIF